MKKFCSIILALILIISPLLQVSAYDIMDEKKIAVKNILITKSELKKISKGEQYVQAMDTFVAKIKDNQTKLDSIDSKIDGVLYKLDSKKWNGEVLNNKERQLLKILKYLQARINFVQLDNLQKIEEANESQMNQILDQVNNPNISDIDKEKLENAIITIQKKLLEKSKQTTESIMGDFEDYFNYENKGDFEMNLNIDHDSIGDIKAEFKLSDYVTQTSNFDSRFNGHISAMIDALPKGEKAIKGEFSSLIDFISKDGNFYALVSDLDIITEENIDELDGMLDNLKTLAKENNYIEFSDNESAEALAMLKSFHPNNFFNDAGELFSKPMFTAYKKEDEVFSIIPTKYACDSLKVLANKFDPFSPNSCSDSQYKDIIKDIVSQGKMTMTLGKENIFKYTQYSDEYIDKFEMSVGFTDTAIQTINIELIPNQERNKDAGFELSYQKNKFFNFNLNGNEGEGNISLESTLDSRNNFSSLTHIGHLKGWRDTKDWDLSIINRKISGKYVVETTNSEYDYDTGEYIETNTSSFKAEVSGNNNSKNELNNISITYNGNDGEKDYLDGEIVYNLPQLKIVNNYYSDYGNGSFNFDGKWNTRNQNFDSFETSAEINAKTSTFNYDTYTREYSEDAKKVFDMGYILNNSQINGSLNAYSKDELVLGVISHGNYKKDQLELNNEIKSSATSIFMNQLKGARDSKRYSDLRNLAMSTEIYFMKNGTLPNVETFWEELDINKDDFQDPLGNVEVDGCKFGYTYSKGNNSYQFTSCEEGSNKKMIKGNYYDGKDDILGNVEYLAGYTSWDKLEVKEEETPIININFGYDYTSNKTNSDIYIDAIYENQKVFEINIRNTGTIEYKKIDIQAPKNTTPFEEVFESNNYYY